MTVLSMCTLVGCAHGSRREAVAGPGTPERRSARQLDNDAPRHGHGRASTERGREELDPSICPPDCGVTEDMFGAWRLRCKSSTSPKYAMNSAQYPSFELHGCLVTVSAIVQHDLAGTRCARLRRQGPTAMLEVRVQVTPQVWRPFATWQAGAFKPRAGCGTYYRAR